MKRDGTLQSIWQEGMPEFKSTRQEAYDKIYDVLIVGGGMTGITTGLLLQKAGKSVMIVEAQTLAFGTTGGTTAHLNSFMEAPFTTIIRNFGRNKATLVSKAALQALDLIRKHVQEYQIDCSYKEVPGYIYAQNEKEAEELDSLLESFQEVGQAVTVSNTIPVKIPFTKAIEIPGQAQFHPTKYLYALAKEFEKLGGVIMQNCRITSVQENDILEITGTAGIHKAKNLVYATHIPPGVNLLHFRCAPYRSYVLGVRLKNDEDYPEGLAYDMEDPYHYFRTQEIEGEKYLVAGGEDHKTTHEENTEQRFRALEAYVRKYYEIDEIAFHWSSQYFDPTDGLPYIGHLPGHAQNMFVATGFGGIGMTNAHISAMLLTDIISGKESEFRELFDPNRLKPVAGFSKFVKEAADVVGNFIAGKFSREKIDELVELAPGEAKIVRYEGNVLALYKDDNGQLHAVNSACTHIKCNVNWNSAEKSWDCPCHGSRFSFDGTMLTGPARKDLEVIHLEELVEH